MIAEAYAMRALVLGTPDEAVDQIAARLGRCRSRLAKLLRVSFLAPDIVTAILDGRPTAFGVRELIERALPSRWDAERALLPVG